MGYLLIILTFAPAALIAYEFFPVPGANLNPQPNEAALMTVLIAVALLPPIALRADSVVSAKMLARVKDRLFPGRAVAIRKSVWGSVLECADEAIQIKFRYSNWLGTGRSALSLSALGEYPLEFQIAAKWYFVGTGNALHLDDARVDGRFAFISEDIDRARILFKRFRTLITAVLVYPTFAHLRVNSGSRSGLLTVDDFGERRISALTVQLCAPDSLPDDAPRLRGLIDEMKLLRAGISKSAPVSSAAAPAQ